MPNAARQTDATTGHDHCAGGEICSGSPDVLMNNLSAARKGDAATPHACTSHSLHEPLLATGAHTVFINGFEAVRQGDAVACGGSVYSGTRDVVIDDVNIVPSKNLSYDEMIQLVDAETGNPISECPFYVETESGVNCFGYTDSAGKTLRVVTLKPERIYVYWGDEAISRRSDIR